jgi:hypothetical protein
MVVFVDAFATETAAWTPGGRRNGNQKPLGESEDELSRSPTFGAVDVSWTLPLRNVA